MANGQQARDYNYLGSRILVMVGRGRLPAWPRLLCVCGQELERQDYPNLPRETWRCGCGRIYVAMPNLVGPDGPAVTWQPRAEEPAKPDDAIGRCKGCGKDLVVGRYIVTRDDVRLCQECAPPVEVDAINREAAKGAGTNGKAKGKNAPKTSKQEGTH